MDRAVLLPVTLYMQTEIVTGFIHNRYEQRLLDLLNGIFIRQVEERGRFLELSEVTIHRSPGMGERLSIAYINKATIHLATTPDVDLSRGIGGKVGPKSYPFKEKVPVPIRLSTPAYEVIGNMYCSSYQTPRHILEDGPMFLPVTDAEIHVLTDDAHAKVAFAAINKEQILYLQQDQLAQGSPSSLNLLNEPVKEASFLKY